MLKNTIKVLVIIFLVGPMTALAQFTVDYEAAKNRKKAKILTEVIMSYGYDENGKPLDKGSKSSYRKFNKEGLPVMHIVYDNAGKPKKSVYFKYENGKIAAIRKLNDTEKLTDEYYMIYDGKNLSEVEGKAPGNIYSIDFDYDQSGKKTSQLTVDASGDTLKYYQWKYNDEGLLEKEIFKSPKIDAGTEYHYDSLSRKIKEVKFFKGGEQGPYSTFEYNDKGKLIAERPYKSDGTPEHYYAYNYYDNGLLKSISIIDYNEREKYKWIYSYDEFGNTKDVVLYEYGEKNLYTEYLYKQLK